MLGDSLLYIFLCLRHLPDIGMMVRVFANGQGDWGSIPGWLIPKTQKMVLDATLLNTQHYDIYQPLRSGRIWHKVNF